MHTRVVVAVLVLFSLTVACSGGGGSGEAVVASGTTVEGAETSAAGGTPARSTEAGSTVVPSTAATTTAPAADLLPAAAPDPATDADAAAADLAAQTVAGGEAGSAALLRALQRSGVAVADQGVVVQPAGEPVQGIAVAAEDVLAIGELFPRGGIVPLDTLMANVAGVAGGSPDAAAAGSDLVLAALRAQADGADPSLRFFSRYVARLAGPATTPDLLAAPDGRGVLLSLPQAALLLARMTGDVIEGAGASVASPGNSRIPRQQSDPNNCTFDNKILDTFTTGHSMGFDKFLEWLEDARAMEGAGTMGNGLAVAAALASIAKLALTAYMFTAELTVKDLPMRRVVAPGRPGEQRRLEMKVEFKKNALRWANCVSPALQMFGIDPALPAEGPVKDGRVEWHGTEGFATGTGTGYVEFYTLGGDAPKGPQGALVSKTDANGVAAMGIEGTPPKEERPSFAPEVNRPVYVWASLDTRETDVYKNILSAFSQLTASVPEIILETAIRGLVGMGVLSAALRFDIIDRAPDAEVATAVGAMNMSGTLCNGDGAVTISGTDTSQGIPITMEGSVDIQTSTDGTGTFTMGLRLDTQLPNVPVVASVDMSANGDIAISAASSESETISMSNISASGTGSGSGPNASISMPFSSDGQGGYSMQATPGFFCSE